MTPTNHRPMGQMWQSVILGAGSWGLVSGCGWWVLVWCRMHSWKSRKNVEFGG